MTKSCRFCSIKVNTKHPKLNNLCSQLIEYQYIDEFHFYFAKSINEIVNKAKTPDTILFRDLLKDNPLKTYLDKYHNRAESSRKLDKYVQQSQLAHKQDPALKTFSCMKIINNRKSKIRKILNEENSDLFSQNQEDHKTSTK